MHRLIVVGFLVACGSKTPKLQSHDLPKSRSGASLQEPKCADNPPIVCRKSDLECSLDDARGCYVCQCQMAGDDPDAKRTTEPPEN